MAWAVSVEPQIERIATRCHFSRAVSTTLLFHQWTWGLATYRQNKGKLLILSFGWFNPLVTERLGSIFRSVFFQMIFDLISWEITVKLVFRESQSTSVMTNQQAITWANVDQDLCHHNNLLGHNVFNHIWQDYFTHTGQSYSCPSASEAIFAECPSGARLTKT